MNLPETKLFDQFYKQLNPGQKSAVDAIEGPVIVQAGPGTGKTQILTLRIANILRQQGADMAENILALTFTNAGVTAMRKRLASIVGSEAYRVQIFTFHSFAEHVIKSHPDKFQDLLQSSAITDVERYAVLAEVIMSGDFELLRPFAAPQYYVPSVLSAIDSLKRDNVSPEDLLTWNESLKDSILESEDSYYKRSGKGYVKGDQKPDILKPYNKNKELAELYGMYEEKISSKKMYDFNDMIVRVIHAIESDADFQYELQERYQYLLVDEHQDTNAAQNKIIELLISAEHLNKKPNIFTVGDDKQAIYRFQGASLDNFLSFQNNFDDVQLVDLVENYRSGQQILDSSYALIETDSNDKDHVKLHGQADSSEVSIHEFNSYQDELHWISKEISKIQKNGTKIRDIAIIYRENKHTSEIQNTLAKQNIPSVVMAKQNILDTQLVFKIDLLLRSIADLTANANLAKLLYSNVFDLDNYDVVKVIERFRRNKRDRQTGSRHLFRVVSDKKTLQDIGVIDIDSMLGVSQLLQLCSANFASDSFLPAFDEMIRQTGILQDIIESDDSHNQLRFYDRLYQELRTLAESNPRLNIRDVIAHMETLREFNLTLEVSPQEHVDGVRLLTAHKSKGLEYQHVFITNVVDKVWGNKTARRQFQLPTGETKGDNDDERRLLYVGITRAMKNCYITFAQSSGDRQTVPSQFLYDLGEVATWNKHEDSITLVEQYSEYDKSVVENSLFDHELIVSLYEKRALSITALNNYLDCPGRYFVNNLLQVPATYSRSLIYGSLVHRALELFFRQSMQESQILSKQKLVDLFVWSVEEEFLEESEKTDILKKGISSLEGYHDANASSWTYGVENEMRINGVQLVVGSKTITLTGVLDKVEKEENGIQVRVVDYKTGKTYSEKTKEQKQALDRQITFYSLLLSLYREGHFVMTSGVLDFVEPNKKTREYEVHEISPGAESKEELIESINTMNTEITSGIDFLDRRCGKNECDACQLLKHIK